MNHALVLLSEASEAVSSSVFERGLANSASVLKLVGDVAEFIIGNELCLLFLGFFFVSRGVGILKKCFRATPR